MTNFKRRISAFVTAFAIMGSVTVPATAKYVTNEKAITASAAMDEDELLCVLPCYQRADVKAKTKFRKEPSENSKVVASVSKRTYGQKVYLTSCAFTVDGVWYYSMYDHGWVRNADLIK